MNSLLVLAAKVAIDIGDSHIRIFFLEAVLQFVNDGRGQNRFARSWNAGTKQN